MIETREAAGALSVVDVILFEAYDARLRSHKISDCSFDRRLSFINMDALIARSFDDQNVIAVGKDRNTIQR